MTLAQKLLDAATNLTSLHAGLTQHQSRSICESCAYAVLREFGYKRMPLPTDPLDERHAIMQRISAQLEIDLRKHGVAADKAARVGAEILEIYRRIRPFGGLAEAADAAER